jgi:Leucine-rich repeat (LRR) protein
MHSLYIFNLSRNQLTGTLPSSWNSKALTHFGVHGNKLRGPLPAWPAPNLVTYRVGRYDNGVCLGNQLSGQISMDLSKLMPRLKELNLPCNNLTGSLPAELGSLTELTRLDVSTNPGLHGTLPSSLGNLTKLTYLTVSDTNIDGTVPNAFGALTALKTLGLARTKLYGCIPTSMAGLGDALLAMPNWGEIKGFCNQK